ncbi:SusC/RagA family TonB-linked outer membrane protein [Pedobacter sp. MC2016-05]|uniref:SusC/RagA family TonB-linked outer membrane protein n=1 Tax=Pedobacter sp. MC2016-05 TaxID=2994474 RepID=UPI002248184F|nr:SusC/RagA family TonB-linked outer membrane protein [Pedobacter sp. MC2016-05]MCX2473495.1 SusC/RagA family TonB-linked outer membrane protein [Pedobacter sp. MC2016-05]
MINLKLDYGISNLRHYNKGLTVTKITVLLSLLSLGRLSAGGLASNTSIISEKNSVETVGIKSVDNGLDNLVISKQKISGRVTDEGGSPIPGVSVRLKGTNVGTVTDTQGRYSLDTNLSEGTLEFSFIGYDTQTVKLRGNAEINIRLKSSQASLEDVVVIGYGTARKSDLTGAVGSVKAKDFNKGITTSPEQLIQGKLAGVQIGSNNGAPAAEMTVRIRGANSLRAGNQPLFVVDGIPLDGRNTQPSANASTLGSTAGSNPLSFINSNDIESIDVLKDASATAIYGSRGANGVVIITTKKGKSGAAELQISSSVGIANLMRSNAQMNSSEFKQALTSRNLTQFDGKNSTDALDAITRTAFSQNHNIAISSGNDKGNYRVSLGYTDQQGIVRKSDFKKYVANISGGHSFLKNDRIRLDFNVIAAKTKNVGVPIGNNSNLYGSLIGNALEWNPTVPLQYPDGRFVQQNYTDGTTSIPGFGTNPLALIEYYNDKSEVTNILANVSPSIKIIDGLVYKLTLGLNNVVGNRTTDISGNLFLNNITNIGYAGVANNQLNTTTVTNTLNYTKQLSSKLNLNALLGYEFIDFKRSSYGVSGTGFTSFEVLGSSILQNPARGNIGTSSFVDPTNQLQSYFSRVNLNYDGRYLLTATMRADGSTKFGSNNKYGYFPSLAAAWVLTEEGFLPEKISSLKMRLGYGKTGNQEFPAGSAQDRYSFGLQSISQANYGNPNLKWETTDSYNAGIDFGLFNNRITGTVEYFNKQTKDLLFQLALVQPGPAVNYFSNLPAVLKNYGMEAALNFVLFEKTDFRWNLGLNATFQKNLFTNYTGPVVLTGNINGNGLASGIPAQQIANDQPLFVYNMVRYLGLDGNGVAQYSPDKQYVGDPNPKTLVGASTSVSYKKVSFEMSWNGAFGSKIYNNTRMVNLAPSGLAIGRNTTAEIGLGNERLTNANIVSTRFLENGNFIRLNNATLNYDLGSIGEFKTARVFLTGQNLLLITKYSGFDPEVSTDKSVGGVPSFGIDYGAYPSARSFLIGFNLSF